MTFSQPFSAYEILERVGSGATGTVFRARHRASGEIVALKVLRPSLARDQRYVERMQREARIVAALDDEHIVAGRELGAEGGYHYFVMEFVEGRSLRELLAEWGMFPEQQVLDVAKQAASALEHAWQRGVIHRDIKPGNILITPDGRAKLTDMGLAKAATDLTITRDGATVGTPQYISPEQARDPKSADIRSDLYSLGATLYHMLTGAPPFRGDTMAQVITKVLNERAPSAAEVNPQVSDGLSLVIRRLLAKDPALRYQTPADLLEDLRRVEHDETPRVDARRLAAEGRPRPRRRAFVAAAAAAGVLGIGALGIHWATGGGGAGDDAGGDERFRAALTARLQRAASLADRVAVLRSAEAGGDAARLRAIAELRGRLDEEIGAELERLLAREIDADAIDRWLRVPENWHDAEGFVAAVADPALEARLGMPLADLPAALAARLERQRDALRDRVRARAHTRDAEYRRAFEAHLAHAVPTAWTAELESGDYAAAARAVDAALDAFFSGAGVPSRAQLPDDLRAWVIERGRDARSAALARIEQEEARAAAELRRHAGEALAELDARRRELPAARLRSLLAQLRRELEIYPAPSSFRPANDPWRAIEGSLQRFEETLASDLRLEEAQSLDHALSRAYRTLAVSGDAADAIGWIEHLQLEDPANLALRDAHLRLLRGARDVVEPVLAAVLGGAAQRRVEVRAAALAADGPGPRFDVEIARGPNGIAMRRAGAGPLPAARVHWPDLLALGGDGWSERVDAGERAQLREGLALWCFLTGDEATTMRLLGTEKSAFFVNAVAEPIGRLRARAHDDASAVALLDELRRAFESETRVVDDVERALARWREHGGEAVAEDAGYVREVESWVAQARGRQELARRLRAALPDGVAVEVGEERDVTLAFAPAGLVGEGLPPGWTEDEGELAFRPVAVDLQQARARGGLELRTEMAGASEIVLEAQVRFPELADLHRLYVVELHGLVAAFGLLRDGSLAAVLGGSELLDRPQELQALLQSRLDAAARAPKCRIEPDALYALKLRCLGDGPRVKLSASVDDIELDSQAIRRPAEPDASARLLPLQPLRVGRVTLRGKM